MSIISHKTLWKEEKTDKPLFIWNCRLKTLRSVYIAPFLQGVENKSVKCKNLCERNVFKKIFSCMGANMEGPFKKKIVFSDDGLVIHLLQF